MGEIAEQYKSGLIVSGGGLFGGVAHADMAALSMNAYNRAVTTIGQRADTLVASLVVGLSRAVHIVLKLGRKAKIAPTIVVSSLIDVVDNPTGSGVHNQTVHVNDLAFNPCASVSTMGSTSSPLVGNDQRDVADIDDSPLASGEGNQSGSIVLELDSGILVVHVNLHSSCATPRGIASTAGALSTLNYTTKSSESTCDCKCECDCCCNGSCKKGV